MKAIGTIIYKVDLDEINALPLGYDVLQVNKEFKTRRIISAHIDYFSANLQKYEYYLFAPPPLPEVCNFSGNAKGGKV